MHPFESRDVLSTILSVLALEAPVSPGDAAHILSEMPERGFIPRWRVADLVTAMDPRAGSASQDGWPELLGMGWTSFARRPTRAGTEAWLTEGMSAVDLAVYLAGLERLGFSVDPAPAVDAVMPRISAKAYLAPNELTCFWYAKSRHRDGALKVDASGGEEHPGLSYVDPGNGYLLEVRHAVGGEPCKLVAYAPSPRDRRERTRAAFARAAARAAVA